MSLNRALAACVQHGDPELAEMLSTKLSKEPLDTVACNTMMKGWTMVKRADRSLELYEAMLAQGVASSDMTYGILLDA